MEQRQNGVQIVYDKIGIFVKNENAEVLQYEEAYYGLAFPVALFPVFVDILPADPVQQGRDENDKHKFGLSPREEGDAEKQQDVILYPFLEKNVHNKQER